MYFPYLRGKQFELIALREMSDLLSKNRKKISPIIEPVKESSTFRRTLSAFKSINLNFSVVINPQVGDMQNRTNNILTILHQELSGYDNFQIAIILDGKENKKNLLSAIKKHKGLSGGITLIHAITYDDIEDVVEEYNELLPVKYNVIYFGKTSRRYHRNFNRKTIVGLDDYFSSQAKNADYKSVDESVFSEEHLYYKDDGFVGFSDFLTIGDNYSDGGFLPYAIAIHISYPESSGRIKVKHFVSDSNDDASDIAGKFEEAIRKLVKWCDKNGISTKAIEEFGELELTGHFPGLGSIKKLSIMNHIEMVLKLI